MNINKKYIKYNHSIRQGAIKYLVIHDTGNTGKGADANAHFNYFNGSDRQSSAHYFIDDHKILEIVDPVKHRSWHCGDGAGKYGITNDNSIGIEMCINSDGDFKKTFNNTIDLVKQLKKQYNISDENIVRHYDASRKRCPGVLFDELHGFTWDMFKKAVTDDSEVFYRVCIGSYKDINNARKKAEEVGGFIIEYKK